ncbi:MAG: hypothetical protein ACYDBB_05575 [Armatimonadota bacterium]
MTTKALLETALEGGTPEITPFITYLCFVDDLHSPRWQRLIDQGLGICEGAATFRMIEHGVEDAVEERTEGGNRISIHTRRTPAGSIRQVHTNGWHTESFVKEPRDYKVLQWIVEHTEVIPTCEGYDALAETIGDHGVITLYAGKTPAMQINVSMAGTERFCEDVALEVPELFELYDALRVLFREQMRVIAAGPGRYVRWLENLSADMLGPARYDQLLLPVYQEQAPLLEAAGKRALVHYDGTLRAVAPQIARSPLPIIESLTEPPEGDMWYDECRAAWPDKVFWANINMATYALPPAQLRDEIIAKRTRAGKRGLAFEVAEDLPANWETAFPVILDTLREMG